MSSRRAWFAANAARVASGLLALALLGALLFTVVRGRGSLARAEAAAEQRAARWASSALFDALTPEQVSGEILGPAYRELLIVVQAGILADDRVARVRIWNPDGMLVFSSDQRDKIGEFVAEDDPRIEAALRGEVVSVPTEATLGPKAGLAGADEKLFQTFVPLHLVGEATTSGVVQIDQRYAAIEDEAAGASRTTRLALVVALSAAVVGFLFTLRREPASAEGAMGLALEGLEAQDLGAAISRIEHAEASAAAAAEWAAELEGRLLAAEDRAARAEAALAEALRAREEERRAAVQDAEVAERLRELEEERGRLTDELARARAALADREAELGAARREVEALRSELGDTREAASRLEAATAGDAAALREAQERVAALESSLREREQTEAGVRAELEASRAELEASRAELEASRAELQSVRADLEEARAQLSAGVAAAAELGAAEDVEGLRARIAELEATIAELEAARRSDIEELQRAREALANTQFEAAQAIRRAKELERELAALGVEGAATRERAEEERPTIGERLGARARRTEGEPGGKRPPAEEPERPAEEPEPAAPSEEGLSLRERLARAAAARHRPPGQDAER